jgi:hypothetical protein
MSTRYTEPTWQECPRCRAVVPSGTAYCPECGERLDVQRAPDPGAPQAYDDRADRGRPAWLPMALGFGGATILGLVVLLAILVTRGDPALADASASASATPLASLGASAEASASAAPSNAASPSPNPTPRPALANRSIAEVQADAELRTQPGAGDVIGTLGSGTRVFVIGAPQDDESRWYRVAVVDGPYSECNDGFCPNDIGYLADGASEADAILEAVTLECAPSPMDSATLGGLLPLERLACYGGNPIVVTGTLDHCYCDGPIGTTYNPSWLASPVTLFLFDGTTDGWVRFERNEYPADIQAGFVVEATVAMEHDASPDCTTSSDDTSTAEQVLYCRTQMVVESLEVIGFDDSVGP